MPNEAGNTHKAKQYQKIKQKLTLVNLVLSPAVLLVFIGTPLSALLRDTAGGMFANVYGQLAVYFALFSLLMLLIDLPMSFYSGFALEHRFGLSNQSFGAWSGELLKKSILSFVLSLGLILALYAMIWNMPGRWWVFAWAGYTLVSIVLGKLFPVLIVPMFYKYGEVAQKTLKDRIFALAQKYGMPIENVYSINLSKTTKKANAAFMGMGKTKRVVLSDTLLEHFNEDEIETVVAHELGHFKHKDIWKNLTFGMLVSFGAFWTAFRLMGPAAERIGFGGVSDIAALPLLFLIFYAVYLVVTPLQNGFSRWMETNADLFALKAFPKPGVFVSCMEKLARVNLADPEPHPVYEWFFYDHPSIGRRVKMGKAWKNT